MEVVTDGKHGLAGRGGRQVHGLEAIFCKRTILAGAETRVEWQCLHVAPSIRIHLQM